LSKHKIYFDAQKARIKASKLRQNSSKKIKLSDEIIKQLDEIISPLLMEQKLGLHHIYVACNLKRYCSERTIHRYI